MKGYKGFYVDSDNNYYTETDKRYYFQIGETYSIPDDKPLILCYSGYHFCKKIIDVLSYKENLNNLRIGEIETEEEVSGDIMKYATRAFTLIRILTEGEINDILIKETGNNEIIYNSENIANSSKVFNSNCIYKSRDIQSSSAVQNGNYIIGSGGISYARKIIHCDGIHKTYNAKNSYGINLSENIINSEAVINSEYVIGSKCILVSKNILNSNNIKNSFGVFKSDNVEYSCGISASENIKRSFYIDNCNNITNCLFSIGIENCENMVFNTQVSDERFAEIYRHLSNLFLNSRGYPHFINEVRLLSDISKNKENPYSFLKNSIFVYIISLDEFDAKLFFKITGLSVKDIKKKIKGGVKNVATALNRTTASN